MEKGIDVIKQTIESVAEFGNITGKIIETGFDLRNISLLSSLPGIIMGFYSAVTNFTELKEEFADLSEEEKEELKAHFKSKFDIPQDNVEEMIERAADSIDVVYDAFLVVNKFYLAFFKK